MATSSRNLLNSHCWMRAAGLAGRRQRRRRCLTRPDRQAVPAPDLIGRDFAVGAGSGGPAPRTVSAARPGARMVGDITCLATGEGWLYLADVLDLGTRALLGYAMADHMRAKLVVDALRMAAARLPLPDEEIFHSDRGAQGGFNRSSQHLNREELGVAMGRPRGWAPAATGRPALRSPGRPAVARREDRQRFWVAIGRGLSTEDAGGAAGVSPAVGARWFREGGGMRSISLSAPSGRYLSFAEREEIAILRAQRLGVRAIAQRLSRSPSTISRELRRNAATRGGRVEYRATTAQWHADRQGRRPKTAKLAASGAPA